MKAIAAKDFPRADYRPVFMAHKPIEYFADFLGCAIIEEFDDLDNFRSIYINGGSPGFFYIMNYAGEPKNVVTIYGEAPMRYQMADFVSLFGLENSDVSLVQDNFA